MTPSSGLLDRFDRRYKALVGLAALVVIAAGIRSAGGVLDSLLLAVLLTVVVLPVFEALKRRGFGTGASLAATTVLLASIALALLGFLGVAATQLVQVLPTYQVKMEALRGSLEQFLVARGIKPEDALSLDLINPGRLLGFAAGILSAVGQVLSQSLLLILIVAFILVETSSRGQRISPDGIVGAMARDVRQYLVITAATGLGFSVLVYLFMVALGTDLALVWAVLAFVMNFVPNIGMVLSLIPPVLLTLLESGWQRAVAILAGFLVLNFVIDNIVKPKFMKTGLDISPLVTLLSLIVWSYLLGPMGALLAVPITIVLRRWWQQPLPTPEGAAPAVPLPPPPAPVPGV